MRRAMAIVGAVALSAALAGVPGRAATTVDIQVRNFEMLPAGAEAFAGDTLRFSVTSGQHRLVAYDGGTFDTGVIAAGQTVDVPFGGGTARYRCTVPGHSTLSATGVCDGMCGIVSDAAPTIPAPDISSPTDGAVLSTTGTTVSGGADAPATRVWIYSNGGRLADADVSGGTYSRGVNLSPGEHRLTVVALDDDGFESPPSEEVTIRIEPPDSAPPTVELSAPSGVSFRPVAIAGVARDDVRVNDVDAVLRDLVFGTDVQVSLSCAGCGTQVASFSGSAPVGPGAYQIVVTATDGAGKTGVLVRNFLVL